MKAKKKIRLLRVLAIAGSMSALAVPTAVAMPIDGPSAPMGNDHSTGATILHRSFTVVPKPEVATSAPKPYTLPASFRPEVGAQGSPTTASAPSVSVVRQIHTDDNTLAIVLAAAGLAVALCGTGYALISTTRIQRRLVGSAR